jgi:DNA-binding CsgD family transcriptional regulator
MWSNTATRFEETRQRERELNDRQRKVLDLIEKGHTNREIADMLGMTVDGAKWNVSEILGKLALDSREDAAEYWRWRQRRAPAVVRAIRALFGLPAAKWVAGGTAAVAVGTTVAVVLLSANGSQAGQTAHQSQFYLEATVVHRIDPENPTEHVLRWWHHDSDQARWDYDQVSPAIRSTRTTTVIDGTEQFKYSRDGSDVVRGPLDPTGNPLGLPSDGIFVGPVRQANLAEVLADLSSWGDEVVTAEVVGYEDVGGTQATVIEWASGTIWLDTSEMVVLRNHLDSMRAEVTRFERRPVSEDEVRLAAEIVARPTSTPIPPIRGRPPSLSTDTNVLRATYLPGNIRLQTGSSNGCRPFDCYYETVAMSEAQMTENQGLPDRPLRHGEYIWIEQRTGLREMPSALMSGAPVSVRGVTGYLDESGTNPVLSWQEPDGRIVRIEGSLVPAAELMKVAEGLAKPGP